MPLCMIHLQNLRERELRLVQSQHHITQPQLEAFDISTLPLD